MTRRLIAVFGLGLAFALSGHAFAAEPAAADSAEKCMGGAPGAKCGAGPAEANSSAEAALDVRVQFDKEDARGEIKCKKGKLKNGKVVYAKCAHDKLDKYGDVAVRKKILKKKLAEITEKKRKLAKKLAFYDSAHKALKQKLAEMADKKEDMEHKKAEGALKSVDKEFDKSIAACAKEDTADFACPKKD